MKVLVTGGAGFLGSHVSEFYRTKGWEVLAYDNLTKFELNRTGHNPEKIREYNQKFLNKIGAQLVEADIRDYQKLLAAARSCDYIIHTAAQPAMTIGIEDPDLDFTSNVVGTYNVLSVAKKLNIPVVNCCTIHVYGNGINDNLTEDPTRYLHTPVAISEDFPILTGKITPLHASKICGEHYVRMFIDTYGLKAASFRLTGLYGERQFGGEDHGWVANFTIRTVMNRPISLFNTGKQVRDILHAKDLCECFHAFYEQQIAGVYTVGGGPEHMISLIETLNYLGELNNNNKSEIKFAGERFGDLNYFVSDITKVRTNLKWQPKIKPKQGISYLYNWVRENRELFEKQQ
ncbi:MAG: NAD-dependent epimerase/dehydratase family protein [Oligoflexia bacterium]|nr:NAD-dependent epimerase/dehydratase family protein [Oligoflexia bacterium]